MVFVKQLRADSGVRCACGEVRLGASRRGGAAMAPFHAEIVDAAYAQAAKRGYEIVLSAVGQSHSEVQAVDGLLDFGSEALIMIAPRLESNELARYAGKLPVVSLLRNDVGDSVDAISSDDHAGVRMSIQHLVDLGHRKVIHVDGGTAVSAALRRNAFQVEMRRHGLEPVVIPGGESEEDGLKAGYLLQQCAPTAVLAFNDRSALGVMESFRAAGLRVPEYVSIIGFDNSQLAALSFVQLSSVSPEAPQLAAAAVDQAINRVEGNAVPGHVVRTPRLVLRRTTARPRLVTTPLN